MEVVRLAIIWLAYGIKHETITRIHKFQRIAIDTLAVEWSKKNRGKQPNPGVKKLKKGRDEQKEIKILLNEGVTATTANSSLDDMWGMMMYGDEEKRYEGYTNKIGKTLNNLNGWERKILEIIFSIASTINKQFIFTIKTKRKRLRSLICPALNSSNI